MNESTREYFYGKESSAPNPSLQVLEHDFEHEDTKVLKEDIHYIKEEIRVIGENIKKKEYALQQSLVTEAAIPDHIKQKAAEPLDEFKAKLAVAKAELEKRNPVRRVFKNIQNFFYRA